MSLSSDDALDSRSETDAASSDKMVKSVSRLHRAVEANETGVDEGPTYSIHSDGTTSDRA